MTAENAGRGRVLEAGGRRFNEAAADDRGKRGSRRRAAPPAARFNEAAADDRGKPPDPPRPDVGPKSFNEAAADDRGKRLVDQLPAAARRASMRPRPMTAENARRARRRRRRRVGASMRPRPMTAENSGDQSHSSATIGPLQ